MNLSPLATTRRTNIRYGVLGLAASLSMITYLDRACFGQVVTKIQSEFRLTEIQISWLIAAFLVAYAAFEIPSGWLGDVFGPRRTLIRIVLWWSTFTALTGAIYPSADWPGLAFCALLAVQFFFGMGEAGAYPNIARAFHNWFPFSERGFAKGAVWMAGRLGGGLTPFVVAALLIRTRAADGIETVHWRHIFFIFGGFGLAWCGVFYFWFRDRPEQHSGVNEAELAWIRSGQAGARPAPTRIPWRAMASSGNLWALCVMYACSNYGWYFNLNYLSKYLKEVYNATDDNYNYWTISALRGAPLLVGSLACLLGGVLTDAFIRRTGDRKWGRRLFGVIGHGACAACYFCAPFADNVWLFVLAIALAAFCNDLTMGAAWASCLDVGGRYAGIISGCMNTIGNLGGALAMVVTGWVLQTFSVDHHWPAGFAWAATFTSYGSVYLLAVIMWLRFDATKPIVLEAEEPAIA